MHRCRFWIFGRKKIGLLPETLLTRKLKYGKMLVRTMGNMHFGQISTFVAIILAQYGAPVKGEFLESNNLTVRIKP